MDCKLDGKAIPSVVREEEPCPDKMPALAMLYSPCQAWEGVYEPEAGLARGTIFQGLDKPFLEGACPNV